jgi:hypothetical protein
MAGVKNRMQLTMRDDALHRDVPQVEGMLHLFGQSLGKIFSDIAQKVLSGQNVVVADLCCGAGVFAEQLAVMARVLEATLGVKNKIRVLGVDINPLNSPEGLRDIHDQAMRYAGQIGLSAQPQDLDEWKGIQNQAEFIRRDLNQDFRETIENADYIFCISGIIYLRNKLLFIKRLNDVLAEHGYMFVTELYNQLITVLDYDISTDSVVAKNAGEFLAAAGLEVKTVRRSDGEPLSGLSGKKSSANIANLTEGACISFPAPGASSDQDRYIKLDFYSSSRLVSRVPDVREPSVMRQLVKALCPDL